MGNTVPVMLDIGDSGIFVGNIGQRMHCQWLNIPEAFDQLDQSVGRCMCDPATTEKKLQPFIGPFKSLRLMTISASFQHLLFSAKLLEFVWFCLSSSICGCKCSYSPSTEYILR